MIEHSSKINSLDSRRKMIVESLDKEGECSIDYLANRFDVSEMTIRRDLNHLQKTGEIVRTRGGATPSGHVQFIFRFLERAGKQSKEKNIIANLAFDLINSKDRILLDSSTTTLTIAQHLRNLKQATVITTSLPIASELFGIDTIKVMLLGGYLNDNTPDLSGMITEQNLEILCADIAFIGADAVNFDGKASNETPQIARMLKIMSKSARRRYVVADHTKIGKRAFIEFADLSKWDGLITDGYLGKSTLNKLSKAGINVIMPKRGRG